MYFHQCVTTGSDTGAGCSASAYNTTMNFGGNSGSGNYVYGNIIIDKLDMHGTPGITMDLNANASSFLLKVSLLK